MMGFSLVMIALILSIISIVIDVLISDKITEYLQLACVILGIIGALLFLGEGTIYIIARVLL